MAGSTWFTDPVTDAETDAPTNADAPLAGPTLDHLALASYRAWDNVVRYCYHLGARWLGGPPDGEPTPFYFSQVRLAGGTKLEFLQPLPNEGSDFLRRFLHRNGPGPHHLTFKVPDIVAAMDEAASSGYDIVNAQLESPTWKEAFLHPKQSHGIVIQLAQPGDDVSWEDPLPLPPNLQPNLPSLTGLKHLVTDLDAATKLFSGPLAMTVVDQGTDHEGDYTLLRQGPWNLRLIKPEPDPYRQWLADRPGRLLQLSMEVDEVALVPDLRLVDGGAERRVWELRPDVNQGTRVLLTNRS